MTKAIHSNHGKLKFVTLHPAAFLFAAQIILLVVYAIPDDLEASNAILSALSILILVLAVWVVNGSWADLLQALLYFYTAGALITYMMSDTQVTTDELFAIGATFTLLAWVLPMPTSPARHSSRVVMSVRSSRVWS